MTKRYIVTIEVGIIGDISINNAEDIVAQQIWELDLPKGEGEIIHTRGISAEAVTL